MLRARQIALAAGMTAVLAGGYVAAQAEEVPFPVGYRTWAHVKSVLIGPASPAFQTEGGIHHIYANPQALAGYKSGTFPDGAVVVYELLSTTEANGATREGPERRIDVMVKDSRRFAANAGWAFGRFAAGARTGGALAADRQAACLACHAARRDHDYVQSDWRP